MDNMDDSENNAKISDSAYSNSCSNSQSRRSHSSKSTHSGSHSSGSSGYGGKPSNSASSNTLSQAQNKDKKKQAQADLKAAEDVPAEEATGKAEPDPIFAAPQPQPLNVIEATFEEAPQLALEKDISEDMNVSTSDFKADEILSEVTTGLPPNCNAIDFVTSPPNTSSDAEGFSCVISMHDGVVLYTTTSLDSILGYPKDLWIGRSFIDFLHPRDCNTFASQITNGLAFPKGPNGIEKEANTINSPIMVCRIRRYRSLKSGGFGVRDKVVTFLPFNLKFSFKDCNQDADKTVYLMIHATPFHSAFKVANEVLEKPVHFVIRHAANGNLEYIDFESVPYLGYLPQDVLDKDALQLYHPEDLFFLRQIYEKIVREGSAMSSKPYRLMTQNGGFLKVNTEWTSFINPWSMKLEFVTGKHHILEGPDNPDVFQAPEIEKATKFTEEEKRRSQGIRDSIVRIMSEVRARPAEAIKQQMSKRCEVLASFMETMTEEAPKPDEELKVEVQEPDYSYYERDSVMLGGISPHHDYDSKSSTETPISYNQLNYNDNMQRFFDSHVAFNKGENGLEPEPKTVGHQETKSISSKCLSPIAQNSADSCDISSCEMPYIENSPGSSVVGHHVRLTEFLLHQHNVEMEKELVRLHRETRPNGRDKRKASNVTRLKKKEHLARCNATYQPTLAGAPDAHQSKAQTRGVKRSSKFQENENSRKHHCPTTYRPSRFPQNAGPMPKTLPPNTAAEVNGWPSTTLGNNTYYLGYGVPQPVPVMLPLPGIPAGGTAMPGVHGMPGMIPMYYTAAPMSFDPRTSTSTQPHAMSTSMPPPQPTLQHPNVPVPYMIYGHPIYGQPLAYSPINTQMPYPMQHAMMAHPNMSHQNYSASNQNQSTLRQNQNMPHQQQPVLHHQQTVPHQHQSVPHQHRTVPHQHQNVPHQHQTVPHQHQTVPNHLGSMPFYNSFSLPSGSYEQACKLTPRLPSDKATPAVKERKRANPPMGLKRDICGNNSTTALKRSTEAVTDFPFRQQFHDTKNTRSSDATNDKTDGESSYSSFYSSFLKTESGSAEDSGDQTKKMTSKGIKNSFWTKYNKDADALSFESSTDLRYKHPKKTNTQKVPHRKMEAPWNDQVSITPELIYKYQVVSKPMDEVLESHKEKMNNIEQPPLVNEQLGQLYLDLELQGVAARLSLEEGITSSSSSGEETTTKVTKNKRKEFSRLAMIYEEDAPLPVAPPPEAAKETTSEGNGP